MVRVALLALVAASMSRLVAAADAPNDQFGFGYCPPPVVPSCIDAMPVSIAPTAVDACNRDVLRFTQMLGAYRACLTRESERAIGSGNAAIARFRCRASGGARCRAADLGPATER